MSVVVIVVVVAFAGFCFILFVAASIAGCAVRLSGVTKCFLLSFALSLSPNYSSVAV